MIENILLDIDGVLVDFVKGACELHGKDPTLVTSWDFYGQLGLTADEFWHRIDKAGEDFWADLPLYPWADDLIDYCRGIAPITLATSPSSDPSSSSGKVHWIREKFGVKFRAYMLGPNKALMSRPGAVLIDDNEKSVEEFNRHGGYGILFPRPWNSNSSYDPMELVKSELGAHN